MLLTATSLQIDLANAAEVRDFTQTVHRRLHEGNFRSRKPCICIHLTCRHRLWRRGEWFQAVIKSEHDRYGVGLVLVCGGISGDGRTDLVVLNRAKLTDQRYIYDIVDKQVRLYAGAVGDHFILMGDNARPYRTRVVKDYLSRESVERMDWPASSPDLNPI
jgi:hypothetical protein